ncbi:unnamed protein product [Nesidiocoris tenuis]|uniref:PAN2-PAN3 deadenylation complex subunit PAN3 n=1 Tax=Nesidiocoris tenuis TaxID=355587 RepID=A0A6H5G5R6_9HEMI|nr:unnamed protein product [Nesidiocoris tenuis]
MFKSAIYYSIEYSKFAKSCRILSQKTVHLQIQSRPGREVLPDHIVELFSKRRGDLGQLFVGASVPFRRKESRRYSRPTGTGRNAMLAIASRSKIWPYPITAVVARHCRTLRSEDCACAAIGPTPGRTPGRRTIWHQNDDQRGDVLGRRLRHFRLGLRPHFHVGEGDGPAEDAAPGGPSRRQLRPAASLPAGPRVVRHRLRRQIVGPHAGRAAVRPGHGRRGIIQTAQPLIVSLLLCRPVAVVPLLCSLAGSLCWSVPIRDPNAHGSNHCWKDSIVEPLVPARHGHRVVGACGDPLEHMYLPYSTTHINGVPQESKLATYMVPPEFVPRSSPSLAAFQSTSPLTVTAHNSSPTPTVPTYQEYVGGTTYFYPTPAQQQLTAAEQAVSTSPVVEDNGVVASLLAPAAATPFVAGRAHNKAAFSQNNLPLEVDNYHELVPLEPLPSIAKPHLIPYTTSTYKATHMRTGVRYCLKRVHGYRLPNSKCMVLVDMWKKLIHSNIVQLKEVFTTKAFGDQSIVFVYEYHPSSETLLAKHFSQPDGLNGYSESFSSNPNAPRPYSHSKNSLLRQQAASGMLPETTIWSYIIQLTGALAVIHAAGLAARCLDPSKIIHTGHMRLRLSTPAILDVITFDGSVANPLTLIPHYQQEDLTTLGRLILALVCRSLIAVQRDNLQTSLDLMSRTYSPDLRNLVVYLLTSKNVRSVVELMPMIGARYYSQLDTVQYQNDILRSELAKEMENGRLLRLIVKLCSINERPELNLDPSWSETGDRYMLKLFRDHVFHLVTEDGRPFLDMAHIVYTLNKLDAGTHEKVCLMSRDEQSVLVATFAELKQCLEQSFSEIVSSAHANVSK